MDFLIGLIGFVLLVGLFVVNAAANTEEQAIKLDIETLEKLRKEGYKV